MTSAGKRSEINFRGFSDRGRPPFLIFARASISSVNSGNSLYSSAFTTWASTRARSDFKERRDACSLSFIGLPHAEDVTVRAARRVAHNDKASRQQPVADDALLAVVPPGVFDLYRDTGKDQRCVCEIQSTFGQRLRALDRIERDSPGLSYLQ
jgi:hypothetical protein